MSTGRFTPQSGGGSRARGSAWRGQTSPSFRSPPPAGSGMLPKASWEYTPSPRGPRGGHMGSSPRYRCPSPGGYSSGQRSSYSSPYSPQSHFSSPIHQNYSPHDYYTSSPRYGSPNHHGRGRGPNNHRGWTPNKGRRMGRGNWNGNDISVYFSPVMLEDPWKELERLHISSSGEKASAKGNQT